VSQVVTGCLVDLDAGATTASASTYILELNQLPDGTGAMHLGHYADRFRKDDGRWLIRERRLHLVYRGPIDAGTVVPLLPR
jgi:hypothetical protein